MELLLRYYQVNVTLVFSNGIHAKDMYNICHTFRVKGNAYLYFYFYCIVLFTRFHIFCILVKDSVLLTLCSLY